MAKPAVLIVEDNKINALVLRKAIEPICNPIHVVNDHETFEAIHARIFELILMDINLGSNSLDGEAIMKIIKQNPDYQAIKIFAVTGYAMPGDRERFLAAGFDGYFSKPIEKEAILEGIRNAINPDTAQAAA